MVMFIQDILRHRWKRGIETMSYPHGAAPELPDRYGGTLRLESSRCQPGCNACIEVCPTTAISRTAGQPVRLDLGSCIFCGQCVGSCGSKAILQTGDPRMSVRRREDLLLGEGREEVRLAAALEGRLRRIFGRSLKLRQVSAGGCNACEADVNVLGTIGWDLGRFGIQFVASPRHADGLLITGPVSKNMDLALKKTYAAVPAPKIVIAVGACAIAGGPFVGCPEVLGGAAHVVPVDLYIAGCPPHPLTILDGLLRLLGRLENDADARARDASSRAPTPLQGAGPRSETR